MDAFLASKPAVAATAACVVAGIGFIVKKIKEAPVKGKDVPEKMKAAMLTKFIPDYSVDADTLSEHLEVRTIDTPVPKAGEVLVRIHRSPINPSDLSTLGGSYNAAQRDALPCQLGFEASGVVVASGGGIMASRLVGKRVACVSTAGGSMWSEYAVSKALQCVPLPDDVTFEEGCSSFVNPLTAVGFIETALKHKQRTIVHTAGASALGQMVIKYGIRKNVGVIAVVRREEQRAPLMAIGARHVIVTADEDWAKQLATVAEEHGCHMAFDAVAGPTAGALLKALPPKSTVYVYGGLSKQACTDVRPTDLIFRRSSLQGWWLTGYLKSRSLLGLYNMTSTVGKLIKSDLATSVRTRFPLEETHRAIHSYVADMSSGKVCVAPHD